MQRKRPTEPKQDAASKKPRKDERLSNGFDVKSKTFVAPAVPQAAFRSAFGSEHLPQSKGQGSSSGKTRAIDRPASRRPKQANRSHDAPTFVMPPGFLSEAQRAPEVKPRRVQHTVPSFALPDASSVAGLSSKCSMLGTGKPLHILPLPQLLIHPSPPKSKGRTKVLQPPLDPRHAVSPHNMKLLPPAPFPPTPIKTVSKDGRRTITTTKFALTMDNTSDVDMGVLLGLPSGEPVSAEEIERGRGLVVSPDKKENGKGKFKRDGLAESAERCLSHAETALILWSRDRHPPPDAKLDVVRVVHVTMSDKEPRNGIVLCQLASTYATPATAELKATFGGSKFTVLLAFGECSAVGLKEGATLKIWRSWYMVTMGEDTGEDDNLIPGQETNTLICSRFAFAL